MYITGWHALYTKSRSEKKVKERLDSLKIESYLPLYWVERKWSDRMKKVEVPLFNSYIFVKPKSRVEYFAALQCDGAVRFITLEGKANIVPDKEIDTLRLLLSKPSEIQLEPSIESFAKGEWVEISNGPLKGIMGELVDFRGQHKFLIRVGALEQSIVVNVPISQIAKVKVNS